MSYAIQFVINKKNRELLDLFASEAAKMLPEGKRFPAPAIMDIGGWKSKRTPKIIVQKRLELLESMRSFFKGATVRKIKSVQPGAKTYEVKKGYVSNGDMDWFAQATETPDRFRGPPVDMVRVEDDMRNVDIIRGGKHSNPQKTVFAILLRA